MSAYAQASQAWSAGLQRPPRLSVSEWADQHRRLPSKGASEPGRWRTARVPFIREIMDCLSPHHPARRVVFCKSTQVAGTEAGLNWIGYVISNNPAPMLVVQPTVEIGELFSKQRLQPMIDEAPTLRAIIPPARSRDSGNTTLIKEFPGGLLRITGSNSAAGLRSMPAKFLFMDEVDAYDQDVEGEGDPVTLAERRTSTFPRRKILMVSTPTIRGASRIDAEYLASDQRRYHVPCPHCGEYQHLKWANLGWDEALTAAWYNCEHCGVSIAEHEKPAMLAAGRWVAAHPEREVAGFHINALYTPIGLGDSWLDHARRWRDVQADAAQLKSFINTVLGEAWEDRSSDLKPNELAARAEAYPLRSVPVGCLLLTAGVDTQDDRLEVQVVGWGRGETLWVLDYQIIVGSPALEETWQKLDNYLQQPFTNAYGLPLKIEATAIDSGGHHTHTVYNFCRWRAHRRVIAIRGVPTPNKAVLGRPSNVDVKAGGSTHKAGVQLWPVGSDTGKSAIYARLKADGSTEITRRKLHFPQGLAEDYYEQLTAETFDPSKNRWLLKKGRRNEALDTMVYATAAAQHPDLNVHKARDADWMQLEHLLQPMHRDLFAAPPQAIPPPAAETPATPTDTPAEAGVFVAQSSDWLGQDTDNWLD